MPTATATTTTSNTASTSSLTMNGHAKPGATSKKATKSSTAPDSLHHLYNRAARAFLHRDANATHSLLETAFSILGPPSPHVNDVLHDMRKRWDILRITFETTIYSAPPTDAPDALRQRVLAETPQSLIKSLHSRSLDLFSPASGQSPRPEAAYLPPPILITLSLSSLKLDCPDVGRELIEEWLARRGLVEGVAWEGEGYEKVIETYTIRLLPKLGLWDYAKEFLEYETEIPQQHREKMKGTLESLHEQYLIESMSKSNRNLSQEPTVQIPTSSSPSPERSISPSSSSSSSLSTTSTRTAVPGTPRASGSMTGFTRMASPRSTARTSSSGSTATPRNRSPTRFLDEGASIARASTPRPGSARTPTITRSSSPQRVSPRPPTTSQLVRSTILNAGRFVVQAKWMTMLVIFVLYVVLRFRRRQRQIGGATELVKGRLRNAKSQGPLGELWTEMVRVVVDTVKMGGGGLV